jgi:cytochrome P450/NADPH-cytochrome P450 reductase
MGPITVSSKGPIEKTRIAGKYEVEPDWQILLNLKIFMRDPKVWGDDGDQFKPERFLNGGFERLPPNAWKPFGDGMRSCIGRGFAEQEMIMTVALMVQNFQVEMADPSYDLREYNDAREISLACANHFAELQTTLTIKPTQFDLKVRRRQGRDLMAALGGSPSAQRQTNGQQAPSGETAQTGEEKPITILYGSNAGTCKTYAEELSSNAPRYGFRANVGTLDSATEHIPSDQPVVIISPSYEGKPADNANKFCQWLQTVKANDQLKGIKYSVFSVGNSEWAHTFHRIPKLIDEHFEKLGAERFTKTGFVDVKYDIVGPWEDWKEQMWTDLRKSSGVATEVSAGEIKVEITPPKFASHLGGPDIGYGVVMVNRDISEPGVGLQKKHMDVQLPAGMSYRSVSLRYIRPCPVLLTQWYDRVITWWSFQPTTSTLSAVYSNVSRYLQTIRSP